MTHKSVTTLAALLLLVGSALSAPAFAGAAPAPPPMAQAGTYTPSSGGGNSLSMPSLAPGSGTGSLFGVIFYPLAPQDIGYSLLQRIFGPEVTTIASGGLTLSGGTSSSSAASATNVSGAGSVLADGFGVMNTGILLIVALMTIFGSLTGILHTANRGEWMGRNGSVFWAPVRVIIGGGALMPVFGGYSLVQAMVLWTTMAGMGVANRAADVMISAFVSRPAVVAPSPPAGRQIAEGLLAGQACAAYYNAHTGAQIDNYNPAKATPTQWYVDELVTSEAGGDTTEQLVAPTGSNIWTHSFTSGSSTDETQYQWVHIKDPQNWKATQVPTTDDICGGVGFRVPLNLPSHGWTNGLLGEVSNPQSERMVQNFMFNAEQQGVQAAAADTKPLATLLGTGRAPVSSTTGDLVLPSPAFPSGATPAPQAVAGGATVPVTTPPAPKAPSVSQVESAEAAFAQASAAFDTPVVNASNAAIHMLVGQKNMQAIVNVVEKEGWLTIGGLWLNLARLDQSEHNLASPHTAISTPATKGLAQSSRGAIVVRQAIAIGSHPTTALGRLVGTSARKETGVWGWIKGIGHVVSDVISRVLMAPAEIILSVFVGSSGGWGNAQQTITSATHTLSNGNPLILFMEAGQLMLTFAGWIIVTALAAYIAKPLLGAISIGSAITGNVVGALGAALLKKIITKVVAFAMMAIAAFLIGGFFLAILLPALPLIAFLSAAMGWMLMVAETMMAAPLWAAAHVSFEGEGWAPQRAQLGYQMVAGLVLRPIMITIGAFLAMALMEAAAWLIGISFLGYASAYLNGTQSVTQALEANGLVIVLIGMLVYVCHMSVRVITVLPDQVLKWIGGGTDALGAAADMQGHVNKVMGVVVSHSQGAAANIRDMNKATGKGGGLATKGKEGGAPSATPSSEDSE